MNRFEKWAVALFLVLVTATAVYAKTVELQIEYGLDPAYEPFITEFRLYIEEPGTDNRLLLATQPLVNAREWTTPTIEVPPGRTMNYYLSAVYEDDAEEISPAYPFALRGKPTVIKMTRIK